MAMLPADDPPGDGAALIHDGDIAMHHAKKAAEPASKSSTKNSTRKPTT